MEFITCSLCGNRVQQSNGIDICNLCVKTKNDRVKILAIKRYLEVHPNATAQEVMKDLAVTQRDIDRLIKDGSLKLIYSKEGMKVVNTRKEEKEITGVTEEDKRKENLTKLASLFKPYANEDRGIEKKNSEKSRLLRDLNKRYNKDNER